MAAYIVIDNDNADNSIAVAQFFNLGKEVKLEFAISRGKVVSIFPADRTKYLTI